MRGGVGNREHLVGVGCGLPGVWFDRLTRNAGWGVVVGCPEEAGLKPARTHEGAETGSEGLGALGAVGCQGWLGCGRVVGWHWVPAPFGRLRAGLTPGWRGRKTGGSGLGAGRGGWTRPSVDSGSAHHERGGAADAGCAEDGRVGDRAPTQDRDADAGMAGGGGKGRVRLPEPGWRAVPLANVRRGCLEKRRTSR